MFGIGLFKFDSNFEIGLDVNSLVDLSECSFIDFSNNFVVFANFLGHLRHDF